MSERFSREGPEENEIMVEREYKVRRISEGLQFGEGAISGQDSSPEDLAAADDVIEHGEIIVPIDVDDETGEQIVDDGCGDGRHVNAITKFNQRLKRSLNRYKVFGGGLVMGAATRIGLGKARGQSYTEVYVDTIDQLGERAVDFGAHTGHVDNPNNSGCGALDGTPEVIENSVKYAEKIWDALPALGLNYEGMRQDFDEITANNAAAIDANQGRQFSGAKVMGLVKKIGKVVKDLGAGHLERRIVISVVPGHTINQKIVREATGGRVQIFATDLPRLQEIAEQLYDTPEERRKAFLAQVIYTLAVAATLTKGDLPIYLVQPVHAREPQLATAA